MYSHSKKKSRPTTGLKKKPNPWVTVAENQHANVARKPGDVQEDRLKGMEADGAVLVIRCDEQENDARDEAEQIAQGAGHIFRQTAGGRGRRDRAITGTSGAARISCDRLPQLGQKLPVTCDPQFGQNATDPPIQIWLCNESITDFCYPLHSDSAASWWI